MPVPGTIFKAVSARATGVVPEKPPAAVLLGLIAAVLGPVVALGLASAAQASPSDARPAALFGMPSDVFVEVSPSTVEAGEPVSLRASCPDNSKPATVRSDAFGRVTVEPHSGVLTARVTIRATQDPRTFTVRLACSSGETATATLHVVARTRPSQGPATGFGGTSGEGPGRLLVGAGLLALAAGAVVGLLALRRRAES